MKRLSPALVVLAALFWGLSGGIGGVLMNSGWDAYVVSFYRGAIGLIFVFLWLILRPRQSGFRNPRLWFWAVIAGLGVAGNFAFYFLSISEGSVAVASTLMYSAPVFVYLTSFLLKLEPATTLKWAAVIMVMIGIVLLTGIYEVDSSAVTLFGIVAGLLAGLSYALFIFGFKYAAPHGSPQAILTIAFTVIVVTLIWLTDSGELTTALISTDWPLFALLGILGAGISFIIYIVGLKKTAPAVASIIAMIEPITASLFGVLILSEKLALFQFVGMALILIAVTALSLQSGSSLLESSSDQT
jgi:drug/metabolite transporter (DMT)-like permease